MCVCVCFFSSLDPLQTPPAPRFVHLMVLHLPDARIAADAEFVTDQRRCIAEWSGERAQRLLKIILTAAADRVLDSNWWQNGANVWEWWQNG